MKSVLPLFIMVDACGWEILKNDPFCRTIAPRRRRLDSVFGYSSTCVPSIVSGAWPDEHRNWCYFVYDPKGSPFRSLRWFRHLPKALTSRRRVRQLLTRWVKRRLGFRGYFDLYNIPFEHIHLFDFTEKKSPLRPGGMNRGNNIFDFLEKRRIPYFGSRPEGSETENFEGLKRRIEAEDIDFAFIYWPGLDGLLHRVGNDSSEIGGKLREYERWISELMRLAESHYDEVRLYIFSDHGMANCDEHLDLKARIDSLGLTFGEDYAAVYDSTMARFWFLKEGVRERVVEVLEGAPQGRILPDEELKEMRALFSDRYFGELIFLAREGVLIVPSHMGERPIRAMHGYHPRDPHSYAALLSRGDGVPEDVRALPDLFRLMTRDAEEARSANRISKSQETTYERPPQPSVTQ